MEVPMDNDERPLSETHPCNVEGCDTGDTVTHQEHPLRLERFVWNDDCPAWPVRIAGDGGPGSRAFVTAQVLLAMIKSVARNTDPFGRAMVDDEDAVEQVRAIARSTSSWHEGRLVYDVSVYVINTGSMLADVVEAAGYEAIGEEDL